MVRAEDCGDLYGHWDGILLDSRKNTIGGSIHWQDGIIVVTTMKMIGSPMKAMMGAKTLSGAISTRKSISPTRNSTSDT